MSKLVCDFCASETDADRITWEYPAKTFTMFVRFPVATMYTSHGNWGACVKCHRLIDDGDQEKLVQRSVDVFFANERMDMDNVPIPVLVLLKTSMRELQDEFFANRTGPCKLVR
jgi:hypothetical protein